MSSYQKIMVAPRPINEVWVTGVKRWKDPVTGRPHQKSKAFIQAIGPDNKNAQGQVKTREEIKAELRAERDAWLAEGAPDA